MIRLQGAAGRGERLRSVLFLAARPGSIDLGQGYHDPTATRDHSTVGEAFILLGDHQQLSAYHRIRCVASGRSHEVRPRSVLISGEALAVCFGIVHGPHWLEKRLKNA
jgi:hypothetical protein